MDKVYIILYQDGDGNWSNFGGVFKTKDAAFKQIEGEYPGLHELQKLKTKEIDGTDLEVYVERIFGERSYQDTIAYIEEYEVEE